MYYDVNLYTSMCMCAFNYMRFNEWFKATMRDCFSGKRLAAFSVRLHNIDGSSPSKVTKS